MPLGPMRTKAQKQAGMHEVMGEFKRGQLRSGSKTGPKVKSRKQAIAIGLSQTGQARRGYAEGGIVTHDADPDLPPVQDEARLEQQIHYPPEYLQTMRILHENQQRLQSAPPSVADGGTIKDPNFFYRPNRERPAPPARISGIRTPRQGRWRRPTQPGDIEELFDHSTRHSGRTGVRHLDDGGGDGSGGGCGGCGGCGGGEGAGCGCTGDSCGSGACGGCSCGSSGAGTGTGIGGLGGAPGSGGTGAAGGSSGSSGGVGDAAGMAGAAAAGAFGAGAFGGIAGAAEAAGIAGAAEAEGGGKGGAMGVGFGCAVSGWGGPTGGPTGVTGDPTGNLGAVAGNLGAPTGNIGAPGNTGLGAVGAFGPGACSVAAACSPAAFAGGYYGTGGPGIASGALGANTGGFYGSGPGVGLGFSGTGAPGTGAFGAEGDAGGGGANGLGNAGASYGGGGTASSGYSGSADLSAAAAATGLAGGEQGGQGGEQGGKGGGGPSPGASLSTSGFDAAVGSLAGSMTAANAAAGNASLGGVAGGGGWGTGETGVGNQGQASVGALGGFEGVSNTATSTATGAATDAGGGGTSGGGTDTASASEDAAPAAADTAVAAAAQDNTQTASQDETTGQGGKGGGKGAAAPAAEPTAPASVTAAPAGPGAFASTGLDAMNAAAQGMPGGMVGVGNIGAESLGGAPGGGGWGTGIGGVGNQSESIGLGAAPGAFADLAGPGPAAADLTATPAQEATPDPGPDAKGALSFGLGTQGLAPAANAIANTIGGWLGGLGYTGVAHGAPAVTSESLGLSPAVSLGLPAWTGAAPDQAQIGDQGWGFTASGAANASQTGVAGTGLGVAPGTTVGGLTDTGALAGDPTGYTGNYGNTGKGGGPGAFGGGWTGIGATQGGQMGAVAAPGLSGLSGMQGGMNPGQVGAIGGATHGVGGGEMGTGGWSAGIGEMGVAGPGAGIAEGDVAPGGITATPGETVAAEQDQPAPPASPFGNPTTPGQFGAPPAAGPNQAAPGFSISDTQASTDQTTTDQTTNTDTTLGAPGDYGFGIGSQGFSDEGYGPGWGGPTDNPAPAPSYGGSKGAGLGLGSFVGTANAGELSSQNNDQAAAAASLAATTQAAANQASLGTLSNATAQNTTGLVGGFANVGDLSPSPTPGAVLGGPSFSMGDPSYGLGTTPAAAPGDLSAYGPNTTAQNSLNTAFTADFSPAAPGTTNENANEAVAAGHAAAPAAAAQATAAQAAQAAAQAQAENDQEAQANALDARTGALESQTVSQAPVAALDTLTAADRGISGLSQNAEALDAQALGDQGRAGQLGLSQTSDLTAKGDRDMAPADRAAPVSTVTSEPLAAARGDRDMTAQDRAAPVSPVTNTPLSAIDVAFAAPGSLAPADLSTPDPGALSSRGAISTALDPGGLGGPTPGGFAAPVGGVVAGYPGGFTGLAPTAGPDDAPDLAAPGALAPAMTGVPDPGALSSKGAISTAMDPGGLGGPTPGGFTGTVSSDPMAGYPGGFVGVAPTAAPAVTDAPAEEPTQTTDRSQKGDLETKAQDLERAVPVTPVTKEPLPNIQPPPPFQGKVGGKEALQEMLGLNPTPAPTVDRTAKGDREQSVDRTGKGDLELAPPSVPDEPVPTPTPDPRGRSTTPTVTPAPTTPTTTTPAPAPGAAPTTPGLAGGPTAPGGLGGRTGAGQSVSEMGGETNNQQAERMRQQVSSDPASFAQMVQAAPGVLAGLQQSFSPQQIDQIFGEIGFSRKEQNPAPPDDSGTLKVEQPQQGFGGVQMAQGGLVDRPGYYAPGGLTPASMRSMGSQAHYSGTNVKPAINPPGVHLINSSSVAGRTDRIPMQARTGSFVLPADVVSGLGQGNTGAGAKMWGQMISHSIGPVGIQNAIRQRTLKAPALRGFGSRSGSTRGFADGGMGHNQGPPMDDEDLTPIVTAGGEALIDPEIVDALGGGDSDRGKKVLIDSVMTVRDHVIKHLKKLPRPAP